MVHFMSSSSSSCSSSFPFQSSEFSSSTISNRLGCVSCPLVLVHVLVHLHFNLVSSVLAQFQVGQPSWCEMITELRPSFQNRTGRPNAQSARGDETALYLFLSSFFTVIDLPFLQYVVCKQSNIYQTLPIQMNLYIVHTYLFDPNY